MDNGYTPHLKQQRFHNSKAHFRSMVAGRSGGKTIAGVNEGFATALNGAGKLPVPNHGIFISPTKDMADDDLMPVIERFLPRPFINKRKTTKKKIVFNNGSTIIIRSAHKPERLRGLHKDWAYFDEMAFLNDDKALKNILLGLEAGGYVWAATTPKGYNWFYKSMILPALNGIEISEGEYISKDSNHFAIKWTTYDNPYRDEDSVNKILDMIKNEKDRRQEIYADFVSFEGAIFKMADEEILAPIPKSYTDVAVGVDYGFDHPAVFEVGLFSNGVWTVTREFVRRRKTAKQLAEKVGIKIVNEYGGGRFYISHDRPEVRQEFKNHGLRTFMAKHDIDYGIGLVIDRLMEGTLKIGYGAAPEFMEEKKSYHYEDGEVYKEDDDACDAMRYLVAGIATPLHAKIIKQDKVRSRYMRKPIRRMW